jgi:hypothetical protein
LFFLHIFTIIINVIRGKKVKNLCKYIPIGIITIILIFSAPSTLAFSGYGSGTSKNNPYFITNCSQLQEIDGDLTGYYVLASNIDCTGYSFVHLADSAPFSGTLDGQNHTIKNLVIDTGGLFYSTYGATIKNINISGGSTPSEGYSGSFVAIATSTIMINLHSSMTVTGAGGSSYIGGIVGVMYGTSSVNASSFSGNISGDENTGGIVGVMADNTTSVTDSFTTGTLHPDGAFNGLIVGGFLAGVISNVYTSGTVDNGATTNIGGIIGESHASLSNSFSAANFSGTHSELGAVTAYNVSGTYSNVYYDKYITNTFGMCNIGSCTGATAVNVGNTTPTYFMNNSTNGPFTAWDFNNVWQTTASYPTLRNIALFSDPAGIPNNGDANNDGIQDSYQANLSSQIDPTTGKYAVLESSCALTNYVVVGGESSGSNSDASFDYPAGGISFTTFCAPGTTATITEYFYGSFDASKLVMRNWDGANTYTTINGAKLTNITIAGQPVLKIVYQITDGGALDNYQPANGVIEMISGPGTATASAPVTATASAPVTATASAPVTGFGNQHGNTKLTIAEYTLAGIAILSIVYMNRKYLKR